MKVALYHEYFCRWGGSESVAQELARLFPQAPIYTLLAWESTRRESFLRQRTVRPSFIQRLPFTQRIYWPYAWLFPLAVEHLDLRGYDLVLSSSHAWGKGLITGPDALHVSYCYTPPRYLWDLRHEELAAAGPVRRVAMALASHYLRQWDLAASRRVDHFIAISRFVAHRIRKYYGRDAAVIHPPVDTDYFTPSADPQEDYFLVVSRLTPYKRVDLAVRAFSALGLPLRVIGTGPELPRLRRMAGPSVQFLGWQPRQVVRHHYQRCRALVFPGIEDFGLAPVEAMACGRPVIAYGVGGVLDSLVPGQTGVLFQQQTPEALQEAVQRFLDVPFDATDIAAHAARFHRERFHAQVLTFLEERCGVARLDGLLPAAR